MCHRSVYSNIYIYCLPVRSLQERTEKKRKNGKEQSDGKVNLPIMMKKEGIFFPTIAAAAKSYITH